MIIKSVCGALETFMELTFSVGMFVEHCGREKLREKLAKVLAGMVLAVYAAMAFLTNTILLQCLPNVLYFASIMPESLHIDTGRMPSGDSMECFCKWYDIDAASADSINMCSGIPFKLFGVYSEWLSVDEY